MRRGNNGTKMAGGGGGGHASGGEGTCKGLRSPWLTTGDEIREVSRSRIKHSLSRGFVFNSLCAIAVTAKL